MLLQWVELMVLVHEKGSGQSSLPSRRYLDRLPADGCPRVNGGSSCDSLKSNLSPPRGESRIQYGTRTAKNNGRHTTRGVR
jgi:hypothetical protein